MILGMRAIPRILLLILTFGLSLTFLLFSSASGKTGRKTRELVWQHVEKVKQGGLGFGPTSVEQSEEDAIKEWEYSRALQYEGSGARIQSFLEKAGSGQAFTVSVIGGSVSKGRGLNPPDSSHDPLLQLDSHLPHGASTLYSPQNLHVLIFDWLNTTFPSPSNRLINGAQGGVGAGYFGWCFKEHIPEDSDLVLLELGINDLVELDVLDDYEHLIRGILELPSKPAIINIETFSILFPTLVSSSGLHGDVNAFYDVPSLAIRDVLLPRIGLDPEGELPKWFRTGEDVKMGDNKVREWGGVPVDLMHISALGHALAASLVIRYISGQMGRASVPTRSTAELGRFAASNLRNGELEGVYKTDVPLGALTLPYKPNLEVIKHNPTCRSMNSPMLHSPSVGGGGDPISGLVLAEGSHGWEHWAWEEKSYLVARDVGALASFDFVIRDGRYRPSGTQTYEDHRGAEESGLLDTNISAEEGMEPIEKSTESDEASSMESEEAPMSENEAVTESDDAAGSIQDAISDKEEEIADVDGELAARPRFDMLPLAARPGGPIDPFTINTTIAKRTDEGLGIVLIGYQRSAILGLGSVYCWVDDDKKNGATINGWWDIQERNMGMVDEIATGLMPGPHTLHCEILEHTLDPGGGTEFRIFAVIYD